MKKKILFITLILALILAACGKKDEGVKEIKPISVYVGSPTIGDLNKYIELSGKIASTKEVKITSLVEGKIARIVKFEGDSVYKDQTVAYVDRDIVGANYNLAPVRSPINGTITSVLVSVGAQVIQGQTYIAGVGDINSLEVLIYVPEKNVNDIDLGQEVFISVASHEDKVFEAELYRRDLEIDSVSHTLLVRAKIDNKNGDLLPGMYSDVEILVDTVEDAIILPNSAIFEENGKQFVYVVEEHSNEHGEMSSYAKLTEIEIYFASKENIAVKSGIKKEDLIVTFGREFLRDDSKINPLKEEEEKIGENN